MSFSVINGKVLPKSPQLVKNPSPAEIARRAYDRATAVALKALEDDVVVRLQVGTALHEARDAQLAELREEVVNPPALKGAL